ncbi:MAG: Blue light- and temperature-regulated antirepressor BluF [Acinetobacter bereziniae]|uniref:Blue light- and temperature-regulated antirepressor BluF n=1 Tax=Acinetobacter bereziniae TaxID=106648 RepID=A0A833US81_ACIBZ|nr:MAG: Blue light- and temperature-regulated antirepressor BluF [Acinetobacter bereziniae]
MLVRLCYASTRINSSNDLIEDLNDILNTARDFNRKNEIFGVLYYANDHFFQCLEGERALVLELFKSIKNDRRHNNVIEFKLMDIEEICFKSWSMKYVQKCSKVDLFFKAMGFELFTPSALDEINLNHFVQTLLSEKQTRVRKKVGLNQRGISPYL